MINSVLTVLASLVMVASAPRAYADLGTIAGVSACATVTTVSYCVYRACQAALIRKSNPQPYEGLLAMVETTNEHLKLNKMRLDVRIRGKSRPEGELTASSPRHVLSSLRSKPHVFAIDPDRWPVVIYPQSLEDGWFGWNLNLGIYAYQQERVILALAKEVLGDVTVNYLSREDLTDDLKRWQAEFAQKTGENLLTFELKQSLQIARFEQIRTLQRYQVAVQITGEATSEIKDAAYMFLLTRMAESVRAGHQRKDRAYEFGYSQNSPR